MLEVGGSKQHEEQVNRPYLLSIITPAYNEANNLPALYKRLNPVLDSLKLDWEWIIVDDHSSDKTFTLIKELNKTDPRVNGIRFSRNFGSHLAITCGLHHSRGNCAIIMAADLQDPPETLPLLLKAWEEGAKIVFAVRAHREGEKASKVGFSRLFFFLMRFVVGIRELPSTGSDFFLLDQHVVDAFCQFKESNLSILPLITWLGFRQTTITYTKEARAYGRSGWS